MKVASMLSGLFLISIGLTTFLREKPSVFLIGDSISIHYTDDLKEYGSEFINLERKRDDGKADPEAGVMENENGGDSKMVLGYLQARLSDSDFNPDYLLVNCGLHDIKRKLPEGKLQVEPDDYRKNLTEIFELAQAHQIPLIWIRTTPVVDQIHNSHSTSVHRYAKDLDQYNEIADETAAKYQIPVIDLYEFTRRLGESAFIDHVHYDEKTRSLQAAFIMGNLSQILKK